MEDRRTAIAILLCILVVMVYQELFIAPLTRPPLTPQVKNAGFSKGTRSEIKTTTQSTTAAPKPVPSSKVIPKRNGHPTIAELNKSPVITVKTELVTARIAQLGGRIIEYRLNNYAATLGSKERYNLVKYKEGGLTPLAVYSGGLSDDFVNYRITGATANLLTKDGTYQLRGSKELVLKLSGTFPDGRSVTKTFHFRPNSYLFDVTVDFSAPPADGSRIWLEWAEYIRVKDNPDLRINPKKFTALGLNNKIILTELKNVEVGLREPMEVEWSSIGDKYFMASLIPTFKGQNARIGREGENTFLDRVAGEAEKAKITIYAGPKEYRALKKIGYQLERNVNYGIFAFLAHPLLWLLDFFYSILGNYGLAIILLTLFIKTLFLPLTKASFESMRAMQEIQPEMKALRERIKDPNQLNKEMMALYKKHNVNPMGGCLPILIQLPVFLGLYNALRGAIELRHAPFALWITDLSSQCGLEVMGVKIPVMILLMGISMFVQQWMTPSAMDPAQKKVMMFMPVFITFIFIISPFPSGLVLYWLVNNLISIIQQTYLRSDKKANPLHATLIASGVIFALGYILTLL
ncbi:MAG: membrane protein insertase YidC [Candidatus Dadabacteria bacterium]|nr:MAG: membrane protein insertase YidC [Candidatus Dadabacteria bacterium]